MSRTLDARFFHFAVVIVPSVNHWTWIAYGNVVHVSKPELNPHALYDITVHGRISRRQLKIWPQIYLGSEKLHGSQYSLVLVSIQIPVGEFRFRRFLPIFIPPAKRVDWPRSMQFEGWRMREGAGEALIRSDYTFVQLHSVDTGKMH